MLDKILEKIRNGVSKINIENNIDKIAVYTGIDISLMRRGLYPMPGPNHINLKQSGWKYLSPDLTSKAIEDIYCDAWDILINVNTIDNFIANNNISIKNYAELNKKARKHLNILEKVVGHESVLSYSKEKFFEKEFPVTLYVNKALGEHHALPFIIKLIIQEQRLSGLKDYLSTANMKENSEKLIDYALNHERINQNNQEIKRLAKRKFTFNGWKEKKQKQLLEKKLCLEEKEKEYNETELFYGQLATYFLSDNTNRETKNIKKWVDTHIEFEVYRTLFSHGINLAATGGSSKKYIDLALEYAIYSRPNCGFIERIYTNKLKVYKELINNLKDEQTEITKGTLKYNKHQLIIGGKSSNLISYEEFENNHLQDLKDMGLITRKDTETHIFKYNEQVAVKSYNQFNIPQNEDFNNIPDDDMIVGSKTNTVSLYGSAFFNATLGAGLGVLRSLPILKSVAQYLKPKLTSVDTDFKIVKISPWKDVKEIYTLNKEMFTGKFYNHNTLDAMAEKLAYDSIRQKTHFSSYYTLEEMSKTHSLESLIQTTNETDFFKNTLLTIGLLAGIEYIDPGRTFGISEPIHLFSTMFGLTWAAFSGVFDKPVYAITGTAKYLYSKGHAITDILGKYDSSPLA